MIRQVEFRRNLSAEKPFDQKHEPVDRLSLLFPLSVQSRRIDAENGRRFLQRTRVGHHPADVFGFNRLEREFAAQPDLRCRLDVIGKVLRFNQVSAAQDHRALDDIPHLPHVAGPGIMSHRFERAGRETADGFAGVPGKKLQLRNGQPLDVTFYARSRSGGSRSEITFNR